jgi:hypothetical protein
MRNITTAPSTEIIERIEQLARKCFVEANCEEDEGCDYCVVADEVGDVCTMIHCPQDGDIEGLDDRVITSFSSIGHAVNSVYDLASDQEYTADDLEQWAEDLWNEYGSKAIKEAIAEYVKLMAGEPTT